MTDRVTRVALPGGRALTVRPATTDDIDGLLLLYQSLSVDDRHRRFFTASRPPRRVLEELVLANEKDGALAGGCHR